ncbi:hypothetical protein D3C77_344590 [compost metagenome]
MISIVVYSKSAYREECLVSISSNCCWRMGAKMYSYGTYWNRSIIFWKNVLSGFVVTTMTLKGKWEDRMRFYRYPTKGNR